MIFFVESEMKNMVAVVNVVVATLTAIFIKNLLKNHDA